MSQAAYWASWADANVIEQRLPRMAENIVTSLEDRHLEGCLGELKDAARSWTTRVSSPVLFWAELSRDKRPPLADSSELGEWQHGWQFHASSSSEHGRFYHGAHVRNVCPRLGTQPTMVDSDDDRPLLSMIHPV